MDTRLVDEKATAAVFRAPSERPPRAGVRQTEHVSNAPPLRVPLALQTAARSPCEVAFWRPNSLVSRIQLPKHVKFVWIESDRRAVFDCLELLFVSFVDGRQLKHDQSGRSEAGARNLLIV